MTEEEKTEAEKEKLAHEDKLWAYEELAKLQRAIENVHNINDSAAPDLYRCLVEAVRLIESCTNFQLLRENICPACAAGNLLSRWRSALTEAKRTEPISNTPELYKCLLEAVRVVEKCHHHPSEQLYCPRIYTGCCLYDSWRWALAKAGGYEKNYEYARTSFINAYRPERRKTEKEGKKENQ